MYLEGWGWASHSATWVWIQHQLEHGTASPTTGRSLSWIFVKFMYAGMSRAHGERNYIVVSWRFSNKFRRILRYLQGDPGPRAEAPVPLQEPEAGRVQGLHHEHALQSPGDAPHCQPCGLLWQVSRSFLCYVKFIWQFLFFSRRREDAEKLSTGWRIGEKELSFRALFQVISWSLGSFSR